MSAEDDLEHCRTAKTFRSKNKLKSSSSEEWKNEENDCNIEDNKHSKPVTEDPQSENNDLYVDKSLDEHTVAYYNRVNDSLDDELKNLDLNEGQELFFNNVFQQLVTESLPVSRNKITSHIVEKLLNYASAENLTNFVNSFNKEWLSVIRDKFASHVMQAILNRTYMLIYSNMDMKTDFVSDLATLLIDQVEEYISNIYSSHVLRTLVELFAGTRVAENVLRSRMSRETRVHKKTLADKPSSQLKTIEPPAIFTQLLSKLAKKVFNSEKLDDFIRCRSANPVLQTVFLVLKSRAPNVCDKYCRALISRSGLLVQCENVDVASEFTISLPSVVVETTSSHLMDVLIRIMPDDLIADLHNAWAGKYVGMALHPTANFVLQKLMDRITVDQFDTVYDNLKDHMEDLLALNHVGLVVKMAECTNRHHIKQKSLLKHIFQAFHCQSPPDRQIHSVLLILSLTTHDVMHPDDTVDSDKVTTKREYNLHGSLLLQQLFRFTDPTPLVNSFLSLSSSQLLQMALHPIGSHVIEAFVSSENIDDTKKDQFFSKLEHHYVDLACHKTGSRAFDTLWSRATLKQKTFITENLAKMAARLNSDRYGQFVYRKCALHHFTEKRGEWENVVMGQGKRNRLFDELISGSGPAKRSKTSSDATKEMSKLTKASDRQERKTKPKTKSGQLAEIHEPESQIGAGDTVKRPSAKKRRRMKKMGLWNNNNNH